MNIEAGDIVQPIAEGSKEGRLGSRLNLLKQYTVLYITKKGRVVINTEWGKTAYSKKQFKKII